MDTKVRAYHFLLNDMRAHSGDEKPWEIGETRTIADVSRIKLCEYGYHSSPTLWDALQYANGPMACLVDVGESFGSDTDPAPKNVHAARTLIKAVNIDRELRLFAADCAERRTRTRADAATPDTLSSPGHPGSSGAPFES